MRITLAIFSLRPHSGLSNDCIALADKLHEKGHEVSLVCGDIRRNLDRNYAVKNLGISSYDNARFNHQSYLGILETHRFWQNDILIGFNKMPKLDMYYMGDFCWADKAAEMAKFEIEHSRRHQTQLQFERAVFDENGPLILNQSAREKERFQHHYNTPNHRFFDLKPRLNHKNRIEFNPNERERIRKEFNSHYNDIIWLAVGNGFKTKGLDYSIKALANPRLSHCQLWVVGADKPDQFIKKAKTFDVHERLHILGARDDVGQLMNSADILAHPARRELSGTVIIEAIANGLPIIANEVCGNAYYVRASESGLVVPHPFEQTAYENALVTLSLNHKKRRHMANNATKYYQQHEADWMLFFDDIVGIIERFET